MCPGGAEVGRAARAVAAAADDPQVFAALFYRERPELFAGDLRASVARKAKYPGIQWR